ncbi:MAG TPA: PBP1A family penicillin-binding protein [Candidatus Ventricola gallistercoris]|nr:PBP1A family penicillin-binding protein [Candidatus Ventricola gallistercoris]
MKKKRVLIICGTVLGTLIVLTAAFFLIFDVAHWQKLDHSKLNALAQTSSIYDAQGELMSELRGVENRTVVSLSQIPLYTQQAFLAAEDLRFYEHGGIDIYRIFGALRSNLRSGSLAEGASTITQQLAKLTHLSAEKTLRRKLEEIYLAFQIEHAYTKDQILEMYLNTVYFERGAYGIQAAARAYFDVDASDLTLVQSAALAATIKAPSAYAPHTNPETNKSRRTYILNTMAENGFITQEECEEAKALSVWVIAEQTQTEVFSWYVDEVLRESQQLLGLSADDVISGGFEIYTAFNAELQAIADGLYQDNSYFPANASDGTPIQSAMAVVDTQSGAVLAMVGGRDYSVRRGLNRATQMRRQPGSALKPLAVYGPALELGYTTASVLLDEKTSFNGYTPQNAGGRYYGRVTMRTAVRNSLNTTAVRLLEEIGIDAGVEYLNRMHIPTESSDSNLSLALGSMTYGVTPVELAAAYVPYANGGVYHEPFCVERIVSSSGDIVFEREVTSEQVISEQNAFLMTSMLQSVVSSGTGTRMLAANTPVAGKTGTVSMSGGNRDIWMAAYNPEISVTVWMGFDQTDAKHKIPNGITGGRNTATLAAAFFKQAYADRDKPEFTQPDGLVWLTLDKRALTTHGSVMLASDSTPKEYRISEVFTVSNRPYAVSDVWDAPSAPASFYVAHNTSGYPELHFKATSSARYRIQRDAVGESVILTELIGQSGQNLSYTDVSAQPGVLYTYRIIPIHEELLQQGVWLEGQQAVQLAQVASGGGFLAGLRNLIPALSFGGQ